MKIEMEVKKECDDLEESRLVANLLVTNAERIHHQFASRCRAAAAIFNCLPTWNFIFTDFHLIITNLRCVHL